MHAHHDKSKNILMVAFINISFTLIEIVGGLLTNSLTITSDALHDSGDSLVLLLAWLAEKKSQQQPDIKHTFGYKRLSLGSAIFTSIFLLCGSIFILTKALPRLLNPESVNSQGMIILAILGVIFNGLGFLKLRGGQSMNQKALNWHLMEDVLGWVVVLIGGIFIHFWNTPIIDPILTIGYTLYILWGVIKNLQASINILMQGVPANISIDLVREDLLKIKNVLSVHDIHVWSLDGEANIFTGHLIVEDTGVKLTKEIKTAVRTQLKKHSIDHSTIELETENDCDHEGCEMLKAEH